MARPTALRYTGTILEITNNEGRVIRREADRSFAGVPARDLDEVDIARLSEAQIANITGGSDPLYVAMKPKTSKVETGTVATDEA